MPIGGLTSAASPGTLNSQLFGSGRMGSHIYGELVEPFMVSSASRFIPRRMDFERVRTIHGGVFVMWLEFVLTTSTIEDAC